MRLVSGRIFTDSIAAHRTPRIRLAIPRRERTAPPQAAAGAALSRELRQPGHVKGRVDSSDVHAWGWSSAELHLRNAGPRAGAALIFLDERESVGLLATVRGRRGASAVRLASIWSWVLVRAGHGG